MRILYLRPAGDEAKEIAHVLSGHELFFAEDLNEIDDAILNTTDILCVFVDTAVTKEILDRLPKLSFVVTRSTGFEHVNVQEAQARHIAVCNVPHYGTKTVAEYTFALMFALSRNAYQAYLDVQRRTVVTNLERYEGFDLSGKVLGVVGTGAIGSQVCKIAKSLGMEVLAYDAYPNELLAQEVTYMDLPRLLQESDIVTLHVPATPETHHLMNAQMLAHMKETAYLINTARGEVIDTHALVRALKEKRIKGAALDVLEGERELRDEMHLFDGESTDAALWRVLVADYMLVDMQNVIVTPHIAFNTREAKREILDTTIVNIRACAEGTPVNTVSA